MAVKRERASAFRERARRNLPLGRAILLTLCAVFTCAWAAGQTPPAESAMASPGSWGTAGGSTTLMAHDFVDGDAYAHTPEDQLQQYLGATYCPAGRVEGGDPIYAYAQVIAPDGAKLSQLQFWAYDVEPVDGLTLLLWENCQAAGVDPPQSAQLASVDSFGAVGTYFGFTPLDDIRVNNRDCTYTVIAVFSTGAPCTGNTLQLQKVGLSWVRDVAPPPASATFSDVPTSHLLFPYVEAMAGSGVTGGCGGGRFCPDSPLTRGQMAVFLAKALGLEWP